MSTKKTNKRIIHDRKTNKNYMVKQETQEVPASEHLVKKVKEHLVEAAKLIPRPLGSQPIGFIASFVFERSSGDKFDYQSASLVDLENVNVKASDLMLQDLKNKIMRAYGHEEQKVRQDTPTSND